MSRHYRLVGVDGWTTLLLASLVIVASGGLSLLFSLRTVYRLARDTSPVATGPLTLVLGMRLADGRVSAGYAQRLDRAFSLLRAGRTQELMLLGGHTAPAAPSEAACGRDYLLARGVDPGQLQVEDFSRHTLENLQQARRHLEATGQRVTPCVLVTSRCHLARSQALADGLGLAHTLCAAEDQLVLSPRLARNLAWEALLLHWYRVGWCWAHLTRNARSLSRIT
jgi:uncharacterized SAM-binding protein YcdF (DUF218 family)